MHLDLRCGRWSFVASPANPRFGAGRLHLGRTGHRPRVVIYYVVLFGLALSLVRRNR